MQTSFHRTRSFETLSFYLLTLQCPSPYLIIEGPTHAISCFNFFNVLALPFSTSRFSGESGCKDTTVSQNGKIFFRLFRKKNTERLVYRALWMKKIFKKRGEGRKTGARNSADGGRKGQNEGGKKRKGGKRELYTVDQIVRRQKRG